MSIRPLLVDLGVWAGLVGVFASVLLLVGYLNRPPTMEDLLDRAEQATLQDCRGWNATRQLYAGMQENVCQCVADRARTSYGGVDQGDFDACRQRVAGRMTTHPDLDREYAANFPALCGVLEGRISGLPGDGTSQFCQCYQVRTSEVVAAKAAYAFGGGERQSDEQNTRLQQCTGSIAFGEGWKTAAPGEATMHLPPYLPYGDLALRCATDGARFEVLSGGTPIAAELEFVDDDGSNFGLGSGAGFVSAPASYGLIEKLSQRPYIALQAGGSSWNITLDGFAAAAEAVLRTCPEPALASPVATTETHDYPDAWQSFDAGQAAFYSPDLNWIGTFVCEPGFAYLTLQGELVEAVIARQPDPTGDRLAVDVPVTLAGVGGTLFEDKVFCDRGWNEGDTDSCFIMLDTKRLDSLYGSPFLSVTIGGEALDPVALGSSPAIQSGRQTCYRNAAS